jgi:GNAT superfamily N-acetyltransferase
MISYREGNELNVDVVTDLYRASTLGARRPIEDRERFAAMIAGANLVITAWDGDVLVGMARSLSDGCYVSYVADLVVRDSHQKQGIGRELLRQTRKRAPKAQLVLLAAPQATEYYPRVGFAAHPSAWMLKPGEPL